MKSIVFTCILFFWSGLGIAQNAEMSFEYQPVEGEALSRCVHEQIRDLPDWSVKCSTPFGEKKFTAHVVVREHAAEGKTGLEILYWVTAARKTKKSFRYHSTTALFRLKWEAGLSSILLSQGVENDRAYLVLRWEPKSE